MKMRTTMAAAVAAAMMAMTATMFAAEQPAGTQARQSEPIYGYRMMNDQERNEYREKMRNARSADERQALRDEHHKLMQERAKERGVTLPERGPRPGMGPGGAGGPGYGPGPRGEGKGPGYGPGGEGKGPGYGPQGAGKGPGYGRGPRGDCPAGQDCPAPGSGKGPGPRTN